MCDKFGEKGLEGHMDSFELPDILQFLVWMVWEVWVVWEV